MAGLLNQLLPGSGPFDFSGKTTGGAKPASVTSTGVTLSERAYHRARNAQPNVGNTPTTNATPSRPAPRLTGQPPPAPNSPPIVAPINPNTPTPNPAPATPATPATPNQNAIPPGVNPRDWANPTWRSIWMRQHPEWRPPAPAQPTAPRPATPAAPAAPRPATPAAPTPTYRGAEHYFDPDKGTVRGQMEGLLDPSSPLMLKAQTEALQGMNSRGLQNSSMAIGAGQSAMIDAALPIASQDAQTYQALSMLDADYDFKNDFLAKQNQFDQIALNANLSSQEKQQMTATLGSLFNSVIQQVGSIMRDDQLDATAMKAAIDQIYRGYEDTVATYADLLGYNISWGA